MPSYRFLAMEEDHPELKKQEIARRLAAEFLDDALQKGIDRVRVETDGQGKHRLHFPSKDRNDVGPGIQHYDLNNEAQRQELLNIITTMYADQDFDPA